MTSGSSPYTTTDRTCGKSSESWFSKSKRIQAQQSERRVVIWQAPPPPPPPPPQLRWQQRRRKKGVETQWLRFKSTVKKKIPSQRSKPWNWNLQNDIYAHSPKTLTSLLLLQRLYHHQWFVVDPPKSPPVTSKQHQCQSSQIANCPPLRIRATTLIAAKDPDRVATMRNPGHPQNEQRHILSKSVKTSRPASHKKLGSGIRTRTPSIGFLFFFCLSLFYLLLCTYTSLPLLNLCLRRCEWNRFFFLFFSLSISVRRLVLLIKLIFF